MDPQISLSVALCLIPAACCGIVEGLATGKAVEAVARQPEASGKITSSRSSCCSADAAFPFTYFSKEAVWKDSTRLIF